jgi:protein involved in polysaccharide export with SLBB domain
MRQLVMLVAALMALAGSGAAIPSATAQTAPQLAATTADTSEDYKLGVADKVRILVFDEPKLSGEFAVNANGAISFPLIGDVKAVDRTTSDIGAEIRTRLADGYLRDPRVSIDVLTFRPFYILGEVNKPGEYPYSTGLTALNAIATAGGFTYRAQRKRIFIKRAGTAAEEATAPTVAVRPGDTIRIGERYF